MNISYLEVGDTFYGAIPNYGKSGNFLQGWKVKRVLITRISDHSIWFSFDRYTKKHPQRILKSVKKDNLFQDTELKVWLELKNEKFELSTIYKEIDKKIKKLKKENGIK